MCYFAVMIFSVRYDDIYGRPEPMYTHNFVEPFPSFICDVLILTLNAVGSTSFRHL